MAISYRSLQPLENLFGRKNHTPAFIFVQVAISSPHLSCVSEYFAKRTDLTPNSHIHRESAVAAWCKNFPGIP
jgi:hypothetical protein